MSSKVTKLIIIIDLLLINAALSYLPEEDTVDNDLTQDVNYDDPNIGALVRRVERAIENEKASSTKRVNTNKTASDPSTAVTNTTEEPCVGSPEFCNLTRDEYVTMLKEYIYPQTYEWILIGTHTAVFIIGLVGNALVCIAVYRNHTMRTVTNYFIVNLAVADFMVILFCLPATVLWDVTETWFLGDYLCKILLYFQVRS